MNVFLVDKYYFHFYTIYFIPFDMYWDTVSNRPITDESAYITATKFDSRLTTTNVKGTMCVKYPTDGNRYIHGNM